MSKITIPPKEREEWKQMITGEITHQYSNFVLQMQLSQVRSEVLSGEIKIDDAVGKIHALCLKYALAVQRDFTKIFKTW